jgi:hypothetical protein
MRDSSDTTLMKFAPLLIALLISLIGCASIPATVQDADPVDSSSAYIVLSPRYSFGSQTFLEIDMQLVGSPIQGSPNKVFLPHTENNTRSVIKVPPGFYYLDRLSALGGYYRAQFDGRLTLFEAKAGRLNYPGEWNIGSVVHSSSVSGTVGDGLARISYTMQVSVEPDDSIRSFVAKHYPKLSTRLPLVYTKLSAAKLE